MNKAPSPKISYVTPVYNQVEFIEATILSVINQNYANLEYIIVDGGSTDGTLEVIRKYEDRITNLISEPDTGMYDALNKGFNMSSGDIMGWINSDDILLPDAFSNMARLFSDLPQVNWIQGLNGFIDLKGEVIRFQMPKKFSFINFLDGDFKWIQQESTFWRRSLYEKAGNSLNSELNLAGDFELWFRFFQHTRLYNSNLPIGAWRKREGQLSGIYMENYLKEASDIIDSHNIKDEMTNHLEKINYLNYCIKLLSKFKIFNLNFLIKKRHKYYNLERLEIQYSYEKNKFIV
tara:strand:- start:17356 stop:18228 length:873 start_codon:yes stop_codon:yes gene_type:complete